ncbi:uncharacterized protein LOC111030327 isoform X2 [Myzus persicae]|uniref:uncharacterized protein LOC111030327 isoform X2 n=1 Tax=Myzus persicae TaxID=13164 RepID=UPI000B9339F0|nr:uncharacterized protein LOC111030327 isoform X2 [Myzus persicae]
MKNCRRPKIPETIPALIQLLNMPEHISYRTTLREPSSDFFQQALTVEGCDGTFKTTPSSPKQFRRGSLMTFQIVYKNVSFPIVYALLSTTTEQAYITFFLVVRNMLPLNYDGLTIITDYERGLMNAVQEVFPESRLQCCWFHFCQSIVRYCRRRYNLVLDLIKTNPIAARVLRMVLALPHLPPNRGNESCPNFCIEDGFRAILQYAHQNNEIYQRMETFLIGYVQNFWLIQVGPELITVFASEIRTNNYLESFHNQLLRFFGMHPNIWDFIQKLRILENQYYVEMLQARRNLTIRDQTSRGERAVNTALIRRSIEQLNEVNDVLKCLRSMGRANADYLRRQIGPPPSP